MAMRSSRTGQGPRASTMSQSFLNSQHAWQCQVHSGYSAYTAYWTALHTGGLVSLGCHNKVPQTGWFKQQKFIYWRLEIQDQGVNNFGFYWGLSHWSADGYLLAVTSHGLFLCAPMEREIWYFIRFFFFSHLLAYSEFSQIFSSISGLPRLTHKFVCPFNVPQCFNYYSFMFIFNI